MFSVNEKQTILVKEKCHKMVMGWRNSNGTTAFIRGLGLECYWILTVYIHTLAKKGKLVGFGNKRKERFE